MAEPSFFGVGEKNPLTGRDTYNFKWFPMNIYSVFNGDRWEKSEWAYAEGLNKGRSKNTG